MRTVMIIDDDVHIGDMLEELLRREGYGVIRAYSGTEALLATKTKKPDIALLDLMLPGMSGEEVLPKIADIPVIVLSAKSDADEKAELLLAGAADYVTKPFDTKELLARIAVQLRGRKSSVYTCGDLRMDTVSRDITVNGVPVKLTRTEYAILKLLMENPSRVATKSAILDNICRDTPDCVESSLKVHISNLRRKLREINGEDYIEAVWGIGFRLKSGQSES